MGCARRECALQADLYELTMAAAYFEERFAGNGTFELFVRSLPSQRSYLVAAGLEQALHFLENLRFEEDDIKFLRGQQIFRGISAEFFDYLRQFRFTGEVWAVPEGTPVFGEEPLLRVTAPIIEGQIVETFLLSEITFQTMIASKAARIVEAAGGRRVVEFGSRRAHGPEAGVLAARAAFIGGCAGTSNVEAGRRFGVPISGTLAHSFIMAHKNEEEAFRKFQRLFPEHSTLLVDTYDTLAALEKIISNRLRPASIRLDSGDLLKLSVEARKRLDRAGLRNTKIFASGDLDEYAIADLLSRGARIDAFGVGTALSTSKDAPALGGVYKLVDVESRGQISRRAKFSQDKLTYPGRKQVFRLCDDQGNFRRDVIGSAEETFAEGQPLLKRVMEHGQRLGKVPWEVNSIQQYAREQIGKIPATCRRIQKPEAYPVTISERLRNSLREVRQQIRQGQGTVAGRRQVA
jgi:nicotinate phosphoribosyltransferase